jgi:DNA-binding CsgD family transcriptional regulator
MKKSHSITLEDNLASLNRQLYDLKKKLPPHEALTLVSRKNGLQELIIENVVTSASINGQKLTRIIEENTLIGQYLEAFRQITHREKEVLIRVVYGYTNSQIADQLCIARSTVETHRKNVKRKLGVRSHYQLVRFAQAFNLV